jgi:hypothetical protein
LSHSADTSVKLLLLLLFVSYHGGRRSYRTEALDLGLNVGERFLDKVFTGEERVMRNLKHRNCGGENWPILIPRETKIYLQIW